MSIFNLLCGIRRWLNDVVFRKSSEASGRPVMIDQMEMPVSIIVRVIRRMHDCDVRQVSRLELPREIFEDPNACFMGDFMRQFADNPELDEIGRAHV